MTGEELRDALKSVGWTQTMLAVKLGVGRDTVNTWATGKIKVPTYAIEYMRMVRLVMTINDAFEDAGMGRGR